jgi:hypothetical protein
MILVIDTQFQENYGAHDWDGEGECPQRWKFKGGSSYKVINLPLEPEPELIVGLLRAEIEQNNDYCREYILGYRLEADDYLSDFEKSQLEYEGTIQHKEPVIDYAESKAVFDHEYAEWSADQDAIHYGYAGA